MVAKLDNGKYSLRFKQNYGGVVDALKNAQIRTGEENTNTVQDYTNNSHS